MMVSPVRMRVGAEPTDDSLMRGRVCRLDSPYGGVSPTHDLLLASHAACLQASRGALRLGRLGAEPVLLWPASNRITTRSPSQLDCR